MVYAQYPIICSIFLEIGSDSQFNWISEQYENIFTENVGKMKMILNRFKRNMKKRENIKNLKLKSHETFTGPLYAVQYSIVNGIG